MPITECKSAANSVHWYDCLDLLSLGATSKRPHILHPPEVYLHLHVCGDVPFKPHLFTYNTHATYRAKTTLHVGVVNMPSYLSVLLMFITR